MINQKKIKDVQDKASKTLVEHNHLSDELAAIQKELERRASLAKPERGKPWNSPDCSR